MGTLETADPLYGYFVKDVMPMVELEVREPVFHVSRLGGSNMVYRYDEERSRVSLIGKFYGLCEQFKGRRLMNELDNLKSARSLGLTELPNCVVRPLGSDRSIGLGLVEEYVEGKDLDHYIRRAAWEGRRGKLMGRLSSLAFFLAELHKRTAAAKRVELAGPGAYFDKLLGKLRRKGLVDDGLHRVFGKLKEAWYERGCMRRDVEVTIHGDATPTNFIFPDADGVIAIDLERMKRGDRMFDVGMVCGELKHAFIWRTGNKYESEPYIGHFLSEYAGHFAGDPALCRSIARRNPFFMAMTELRIARNNWLDRAHRARLVDEARQCLAWGLRLG